MTISNIVIIGVGGVGGYFGGKLCRLQSSGSGIRVSFVARGEHLSAIQKFGLLLSAEDDGDVVCQPALATDDYGRLPRLDLCLICVKEFDLSAVLSRLEPIISDGTILLPLLNGVDVYARIRSVIKQGFVFPACVYVGTHIESPGKVVQRGGACKILFGPDPMRPDFVPDELNKLLDQARIKSEWTPDIQAEIWKKFIFICPFGLVSAAYDKTLGEILEDDGLRSEAQAIMMEAVSLAKEARASLPGDIVKASLMRARSFPYEAKTSFQRDYERLDKNDERDLFAGSMIRIAGDLGVAVPRTRAVSSILEQKKPALAPHPNLATSYVLSFVGPNSLPSSIAAGEYVTAAQLRDWERRFSHSVWRGRGAAGYNLVCSRERIERLSCMFSCPLIRVPVLF